MSVDPAAERQQQRAREFMSLLPLTLAIAGLPEGEHGKLFTDGQLESRATSIKAAYRVARQLVVDVTK
jgi:hypothetical protein